MIRDPMAIRLTSLERSNPLIKAALARNGAYHDAVELAATALNRQMALTAPPRPAEPDSSDPADIDAWVDAQLTANAGMRANDEKRNALIELLQLADARIVASVDPDRIFATLHRELTTLFELVDAAVTELDGATTPTEAIANGAADAWRTLIDLRSRYDDIRKAQDVLMMALNAERHAAARSVNVHDDLASDLMFDNLDEVFPTWRRKPIIGMDFNPIDNRPWPDEPIGQLIWISTSDAHPWVPTPSDLDDLNGRRREHIPPGKPISMPKDLAAKMADAAAYANAPR